MMDVAVSVGWHWPNRLYIIRNRAESTNDRLTVAFASAGPEYDDHPYRREPFEGWKRSTGSELNNSRMDGRAKQERVASTIQNSEIVMVRMQNPATLQGTEDDYNDDDDDDEVILLALRDASGLVSLVTRMQIEDAALDVGSGSSALDELTNGWPNKEACSHRSISLSLFLFIYLSISLSVCLSAQIITNRADNNKRFCN